MADGKTVASGVLPASGEMGNPQDNAQDVRTVLPGGIIPLQGQKTSDAVAKIKGILGFDPSLSLNTEQQTAFNAAADIVMQLGKDEGMDAVQAAVYVGRKGESLASVTATLRSVLRDPKVLDAYHGVRANDIVQALGLGTGGMRELTEQENKVVKLALSMNVEPEVIAAAAFVGRSRNPGAGETRLNGMLEALGEAEDHATAAKYVASYRAEMARTPTATEASPSTLSDSTLEKVMGKWTAKQKENIPVGASNIIR